MATRFQALCATHENPQTCRVAYATEMTRFKLRLEGRLVWILFHPQLTFHVAASFAELETRHFTLRVSASRRDTKPSRKVTKTQQGSWPLRIRPTLSVSV